MSKLVTFRNSPVKLSHWLVPTMNSFLKEKPAYGKLHLSDILSHFFPKRRHQAVWPCDRGPRFKNTDPRRPKGVPAPSLAWVASLYWSWACSYLTCSARGKTSLAMLHSPVVTQACCLYAFIVSSGASRTLWVRLCFAQGLSSLPTWMFDDQVHVEAPYINKPRVFWSAPESFTRFDARESHDLKNFNRPEIKIFTGERKHKAWHSLERNAVHVLRLDICTRGRTRWW